MNLKTKKGQEEMVGFVVIMLLVAIIFLIFLSIYLRGAAKTHETEGKDVASFLEAVTKMTTNCTTAPGYPIILTDLIQDCYTSPTSQCFSGENKCSILRASLEGAVNATWNFNENSPTKGFDLRVLKQTPDNGEIALKDKNNIPIEPSFGLQTNEIRSAEKPFPNGIVMRLEIYY